MRLLLSLAVLAALFPQERAPETLPSIPVEEYRTRRDTLKKQFADGMIVFEAEKLGAGMGAIDPNTPVYDFPYLAGYHQVGDIIVLASDPSGEFLFTTGDVAIAREKSGIDPVMTRDSFPEFARKTLAGQKKIYTRVRKDAKAVLGEAAPEAQMVAGGERNPVHLRIAEMRKIKSEAEMRMMKKAADATNKAHLAAMRACRSGMNEGELMKLIEDTFKAESCDGLGFPSIVGSGKNGTVLHYNDNDKPIPADSLVVCDIGASFRGYVTDITRTLPTDGRFTGEQREAYQCVLDAQKAAEKLLKPGVTFQELDAASRAVFKERKLTKWSYCLSKDPSVMHGLGHYVGLAVHDSGRYRALEEGVVITIEPGYYDKERGWGIRIEDIYRVTKDGFERWSETVPREVEEIEKLMKVPEK